MGYAASTGGSLHDSPWGVRGAATAVPPTFRKACELSLLLSFTHAVWYCVTRSSSTLRHTVDQTGTRTEGHKQGQLPHLQALVVSQAYVCDIGCPLGVLLRDVAQPQLQVACVVCQHLHRARRDPRDVAALLLNHMPAQSISLRPGMLPSGIWHEPDLCQPNCQVEVAV